MELFRDRSSNLRMGKGRDRGRQRERERESKKAVIVRDMRCTLRHRVATLKLRTDFDCSIIVFVLFRDCFVWSWTCIALTSSSELPIPCDALSACSLFMPSVQTQEELELRAIKSEGAEKQSCTYGLCRP